MKNVYKILAIIIPIIGIYIAYLLNKVEPDLRFSLSKNIPTKFLSDSLSENIQLLEVINAGNGIASKINVKIRGQIIDYDIAKYSNVDNVQSLEKPDYFEIYYPELPPSGTFKLVLKSRGNGLLESNLLITYNNGQAVSLIKADDSTQNEVLVVGFLLILFSIIISGLRNMLINDLQRDASSFDQEKIINMKKPFYISQIRWDSIKKEAIKNLFDNNEYLIGSVNQLKSYQQLDGDKPAHLEDSDWDNIQANALKAFEDLISSEISRGYYLHNYEKVLDFKKPKNINDYTWQNIVSRISESYIDYKKQKLTDMPYPNEIIDEFKAIKPPLIIDEEWIRYFNYCKKRYYNYIVEELEFKEDCFSFLNSLKLELLTNEQRDSLNNKAYQISLNRLPKINSINGAKEFLGIEKPGLITDEDYDKLSEAAKNLLTYEENYLISTSILNIFNKILKRTGNYEKDLDNLEEDQKNTLVKVIKELDSYQKNNGLVQKKLEEIDSMKTKLGKQLSFINECLNDKTAIDRIEEYDDTFSKGNLENLRILAKSNNKKNTKN